MTEDQSDGRLYRFTSAAWPDLNTGALEAAQLTMVTGFDPDDPKWDVSWLPIPNPNVAPGTTTTRQQAPSSTPFSSGEGIWFDSGNVYFTTKGDNRVWVLDTIASTMALVYDDNLVTSAPLTGVDNVVVTTDGKIFVAEDGGDMQLVVIDAARNIEPFLQIVGQSGSEIAGPAFDPTGTRLYFSSQRGTSTLPYVGFGITYEVSGPFGAGTNVPTAPDSGVVSGLLHNTVEPPVRGVNPAAGDLVHTVDRAVRGLGL